MEWIALLFVCWFIGWLVSLFTDQKSPPKTPTALRDENDEAARIHERIERQKRLIALGKELKKLESPSHTEATLKENSPGFDCSSKSANDSENLLQQPPAVEQQKIMRVVQQPRAEFEISCEIAEKSITQPENIGSAIVRNEIQELVKARGIRYIIHFTRVENLSSILNRGLLGKSELHERALDLIINDNYRYDDHPEAVCLSVSFPNYRMFYRVRCKQPDSDWAVIRLNPNILWEKRCLFCMDNAASLSISSMPASNWEGVQALEKMFANHKTMPSRDALQIPVHYTTNPQAEVLALESIEPDSIIDICFDHSDRINNIAAIHQIVEPFRDKFKFVQNRSVFAPRKDYELWR